MLREALVDEQLILDRERLGIDRWDECWSGVYVMSPPPRQPHQRAARRLAQALEALGLAEVDTAVGVGDARDYRVPDVVLYEAHALDDEALFLRSALVVVEVMSPTEDPYAKLSFYEDHVASMRTTSTRCSSAFATESSCSAGTSKDFIGSSRPRGG